MGLQTIVRQRHIDGRPGDLYNPAQKGYVESFINEAPRAKQVQTVTVDSAADGTDYSLLIDSVPVTVTSGTGATVDTIRDLLVDAINAEPLINARVLAEASTLWRAHNHRALRWRRFRFQRS